MMYYMSIYVKDLQSCNSSKFEVGKKQVFVQDMESLYENLMPSEEQEHVVSHLKAPICPYAGLEEKECRKTLNVCHYQALVVP